MRRYAGYSFKFFLAIISVLTFWACDEDSYQNGETPEIRPLTAEEKFLIESSNNFALDLLNEQVSHKNISLSPVSAAMALGMIGNAGSPEKFEAFKYKMGLPQLNSIEINKAFYEVSNMLPRMDKSVKVDFTNSIWTNYDLSVNEDYYNKVMAYFKTDIQEFRQEKVIEKKLVDKWLMTKTNNYVTAIDTYDLYSNFKIINLSTFSGKMFEGISSQWVRADFHEIDGEIDSLAMNFYSDVPVSVSSSNSATTIEIPIGNFNYFLKIILPHIPGEAINISDALPSVHFRTANLLIPDILSSYEYALNEKFAEFGAEKYLAEALTTSFSVQDLQTNLSGINKTQISIKGSKINGEAPVPFNKMKYEGELIKVNRPFYYLVKEKNTDLIVFEGKFFQTEN